ncbi:MAG: serine/threonine-protein phosphatase [Bacteroidales bacterium]|nr:serine/threonine-protein phosphatase [Bacteroidales bacterium]
MIFSVDAVSLKGAVRENNEDFLSIAGRCLRDDVLRVTDEDAGECWYAFVADGMGGHERGEVASRELLEHLRDCFTMRDFSEEDFERDFIRSVEYVSASLNARSAGLGLERAMGTTLCGIVWIYGRMYLVNAGDSRVYRWRDGMLRQLTEDQKDDRGLLLNCVGGGLKGTPQICDITGEVAEDDVLLICSDGVYGFMPDDEMEYYLTISPSPAGDLCGRAEVNGGNDNESVAVIRVGGGDFGGYDCPDDDGRNDWFA